jgi:hypothetical protein
MAYDDDPAASFARAMQIIAESQQRLAQTNQYIAETQRVALRTLRSLAWLQAGVGVLVGLALIGMVVLIGLSVTQGKDHAALVEGLRRETQTLSAQTQALQELLRRGSGH